MNKMDNSFALEKEKLEQDLFNLLNKFYLDTGIRIKEVRIDFIDFTNVPAYYVSSFTINSR
jgi:hypothetical protein